METTGHREIGALFERSMVTPGLFRRANHYGVSLLRFLLCWKWGMEWYMRTAQAVRGYNTSEPPDLGYLLHRYSSPRLVTRDRTEAVGRNGD